MRKWGIRMVNYVTLLCNLLLTCSTGDSLMILRAHREEWMTNSCLSRKSGVGFVESAAEILRANTSGGHCHYETDGTRLRLGSLTRCSRSWNFRAKLWWTMHRTSSRRVFIEERLPKLNPSSVAVNDNIKYPIVKVHIVFLSRSAKKLYVDWLVSHVVRVSNAPLQDELVHHVDKFNITLRGFKQCKVDAILRVNNILFFTRPHQTASLTNWVMVLWQSKTGLPRLSSLKPSLQWRLNELPHNPEKRIKDMSLVLTANVADRCTHWRHYWRVPKSS